ncbi:MAG: PQQ-binding-like beta-propeller repeat protein [Vicinamibacterales bacterium]
MRTAACAVGTLAAYLVTPVFAEDWPRFRGVNGSGVSVSARLPDTLDRTTLKWRVTVPPGRSSPIVAGGRVYVTGIDHDRLVVLALDRASGSTLWRHTLDRARVSRFYVGNDTASSTPASDGSNVFAFFADLGLVSLDGSGRERWRLPLGPFDSFYGVSSSPIVHGAMVILVCDQRRGSFVLAVDKDTGRVRWRTERPGTTTEGYTTPAIYAPSSGEPQLVVSGASRLDGYDLETGKNLWWMGRQGIYPVGSTVITNDRAFAVGTGGETSPYPRFETALATIDRDRSGTLSAAELAGDAELGAHFGWIDADGSGQITRAEWDHIVEESVAEHGVTSTRLGGTGDVTGTHAGWRFTRSYSYLITPLVYRDVMYLVKNGGIITALDPQTGEVLKTGRASQAIDDYFASPVAGDGKVYFVSHSGKVTVLKAAAQWAVLSASDLDEPVQATPAIADGQVLVRTNRSVFAFAPGE